MLKICEVDLEEMDAESITAILKHKKEEDDNNLKLRSEFNKSLIKVKQDMNTIITKNKAVNSYKYADLPSIIAIIAKPLTDNNISYSFCFSHEVPKIEEMKTRSGSSNAADIRTRCVFKIFHSNGYCEDYESHYSSLEMFNAGTGIIQKQGGMETYIKRYVLGAYFGFAAAEDIDETYSKAEKDKNITQQFNISNDDKINNINDKLKAISEGDQDVVKFMINALLSVVDVEVSLNDDGYILSLDDESKIKDFITSLDQFIKAINVRKKSLQDLFKKELQSKIDESEFESLIEICVNKKKYESFTKDTKK